MRVNLRPGHGQLTQGQGLAIFLVLMVLTSVVVAFDLGILPW